jgi:energy-coupling factor transporter ATP-binding protein EcfA2
MKVSIELSPEYRIPYAVIYVDKITDEIQKIMESFSRQETPITALQNEDNLVVLQPEEIYMVRVEAGDTILFGKCSKYRSRKRLYELEKQLGNQFMQISKSTLVNLIPRFYDVTEGEILVDGVNVQDYQLEDLHNKVGYIPQKAVLFSGDIESNLDFGQSKESPLDEQKMWEALDLAQAKPFVQEKEKGLKAEVAQSGTNFSGGQRQRLAIARALARKPEILIFDDSFSALDYKTDRILRKELAERTQDMTKLIVAQRISTIMDADQILVLDAGKVVGQGTHRELLASNEVYQEIAYSQLSKEELENGK